MNRLKSPLRRALAIAASATIGLAGVAALAAPASAYTPPVCEAPDWELSTIESDEQSEEPVEECVDPEPTPEATPEPTPEATEPPVVEPSEPEGFVEVTCDQIIFTIDNPEDGKTVTVDFVPNEGDTLTVTLEPGESGIAEFDAFEGLEVTPVSEGLDETEPFVWELPEGCEEEEEEEEETGGSGAGDGGSLPVTGAAAGGIAAGALVLLTIGGVLFFLARRRRVTFTA